MFYFAILFIFFLVLSGEYNYSNHALEKGGFNALLFVMQPAVSWDIILSHNHPCFKFNAAMITNFLVSQTCEVRFHEVMGQSTVHMYSNAKIPKHGWPTQTRMFWTVFFSNSFCGFSFEIKRIWHSLTVNCDKILLRYPDPEICLTIFLIVLSRLFS